MLFIFDLYHQFCLLSLSFKPSSIFTFIFIFFTIASVTASLISLPSITVEHICLGMVWLKWIKLKAVSFGQWTAFAAKGLLDLWSIGSGWEEMSL